MTNPKNFRPKSKRRKPIKRKTGDGRKTKEELERQAKIEIDKIFNEFADELEALRGNSRSGTIYARHSSILQESIPPQVRSILIEAIKKGIHISREHVFYDIAVRGSKQNRQGLDAANRVLKDTDTKILMVFKTNRLYRKMYRALEYVERLIKSWGARIIFTKDGLDSASDDYEDIKLQLLAMLDEHGRRAHVDNVQSSHLDMFARMLVHGTVTFGYYGESIEGELTKLGRRRRRYAVDDIEAEYVVQIFTWFVEEGMSIAEIVQTLNDNADAPLPPRAENEWTRLAVLTLLKNTRYVGIFKYGKQESIDQPDIDYILRRDREEPLGVKMIEELRIVPDQLFFPAQELIKQNKSRGGRKTDLSSKPTGSEIIRGIFECPEHKCALWISGESMFCKRCDRVPRASRYLHSRLNTKLAIEQLLSTIGRVLCDDEQLMRESYDQTVNSIPDIDSPDESEIEHLDDQTRKLGAKIKFAKGNVGESAAEQEETKVLLAKLRTERQKVELRLREIENAKENPTEIPDFDSWSATVKSLGQELLDCRDSFDSIRLSRIRRLIQLLVGGRIPLVQCGKNSPKLGWHEASFTIKLGSVLGSQTRSDSPERVIKLEFKNYEKEKQRLIAESDEAYKLDTVDKLPRNQIGAIKGWSKSKVTALLKRAYARRGEEFVDGRGRKTETKGWISVHEKIADDVVRRFAEGMNLKQISVELGYSIDTIRNAFRHWHESRGLPVPVSQKKAKFLQDAQRAYELDSGKNMIRREIAKTLGCTPSKLTRLLKKGYELNGGEFYDRRGHGHQRKADKTPIYQEIAATVGQMIESGKTVDEVAVQLDVDAATVNKALSWYRDNHRDAA